MAAVKLKENMDFDMEATYQHVKTQLPSYARPRFIRIQVTRVGLQPIVNKSDCLSNAKPCLFVLLAGHSGGNGDI